MVFRVPFFSYFFCTISYFWGLKKSYKKSKIFWPIWELKISYKKRKIFWVGNNINAKKEDIIYENIISSFLCEALFTFAGATKLMFPSVRAEENT